tara:strand:+ start:266 stop:535 length:270 start_codon:yes stop_codon:yes gene_type:complete
MCVALVDIRPSFNDGNCRLSLPVIRAASHLFCSGALTKRSQVLYAKPVEAKFIFKFFALGYLVLSSDWFVYNLPPLFLNSGVGHPIHLA